MSMASPAILSNFFEKQWTQNHPQYLSGLSRALYPTTFLEIAVCICYTDLSFDWLEYISLQIYLRAQFDYDPTKDNMIPCQDAGLPFKKGEVLQIVEQVDPNWWQVRNSLEHSCG